MKQNWLAVAALLLVAAAWGATFTLIKDALQEIAPEPFMFWRFTIAGVALLGAAVVRREPLRPTLWPGFILGILVFAGYWMQTRGLLYVTPSRSAFLTGLYVVMVPFAERLGYGARVSWRAWAASLLALAGTTALIGGFDAEPTIGDWLTILCAVCFAAHVVLSARYSTQQPVIALAAVQVLLVGLAAAPTSLFVPRPHFSIGLVLVILFTSLVTTALAFVALMWGQARVSATEAAVILSFEPVAAAITSIGWYGEPITPSFLVGGGLIITAMLLSQLKRGESEPTPRTMDGIAG